ncbi:helix-turn-helix transcriptional regulator [Cellulosimicrobium marinum]|uniref:helix-turn-helix transcriptional regulator n=1 Tax=Cellulosimicrobium marinum TaxID=1638992 RepID=UPI001E54E398|nr:helix-turn-helix transcriptional regulator [Cellulosimicrobium marinum]MCB7135691.1 helix-turn-helix domain-containing protein [Cellulosimicrobium marinum]
MGRQRVTVGREASEALRLLGVRVKQGRIARRWTQVELAERVGVSAPTVASIERGAPSVSAGHYVQAAFLVGVPLFGIEDAGELALRRRQGEDVLALLPAAVRHRAEDADAAYDLDF